MPYESPVPPVPTRQQEIEYVDKLQKEFLAQPWTKLYMNEALRAKKLEDSYNINHVKKNWWINFFTGAIVSGIFIFPLGRFFYRFASGVPHYFRHKMYYVDFDAYLQGRNIKALNYQLPLWVLSSSFYAYYFTDFKRLDDEYFETMKVKPMFDTSK